MNTKSGKAVAKPSLLLRGAQTESPSLQSECLLADNTSRRRTSLQPLNDERQLRLYRAPFVCSP
jgi:hypothetical protein